MQSLRKANGLNRWMVKQMAPFLGQRVLEAGSGIGNLSQLLLNCKRLACLDIDPFYIERLGRRFGHLPHVSFHKTDLHTIADDHGLKSARLDTVVCVNVLEHVRDDDEVLRGFYDLLEPGGHACLLAPAHPWLYAPIDEALGHFRRYTRDELEGKLRSAGFEVVRSQGFNRLGTLGWLVSGKLLGKRTISEGQMKAFEWLLPIAKLIERAPVLPNLSWIVVGRKPTRGAGAEPTKRAA